MHLPNSLITDAVIATLLQLSELEELNISNTAVTAQGLELLQQFPKLRSLFVWSMPLSAEALAAFQQARPQCKVWKD